ncbi:MAG: sigma-54-dependent Fis family transcriptional regulator [Planctomycetes bacterium]|nr:sigma-54-dependent Fis family transcriptional regulator [Planctomycetota bacterium]
MFVAEALLLCRDKNTTEAVHQVIASVGNCRLQVVQSVSDVLSITQRVDVALVIIHLDGCDDLREVISFLQMAAASTAPLAAVIISDRYDAEQELTVMRHGAADYLVSPIDSTRLALLVEVLTVQSRFRGQDVTEPPKPALKASADEDDDSFFHSSPAMARLMQQVGKAAAGDTHIMLAGETGSGKTRLARLIHQLSPRAKKPYFVINCAALPISLIESELFGHVQGAFTGADRDRVGKFAEAADGTLLLDDIDVLPLAAQGKLLQAVDEGTFTAVGSNRRLRAKARLITASNRSLIEEVKAGRFRADLLYRLNIVEFRLPPLRERRGEIRELAERFTASFAAQGGRSSPHLAPETIRILESYHWPGNVRELHNALRRGVTLCSGDTILPVDLPEAVWSAAVPPNPGSSPEPAAADSGPVEHLSGPRPSEARGLLADESFCLNPLLPPDLSPLAQARIQAEIQCIVEMLAKNKNNRSRTAEDLGISRVALYKKLHRYGLMPS